MTLERVVEAGIAANRIGRRYLGIEINPEYAEASQRRLAEDAPLLDVPRSTEQLTIEAVA